MTGRARPTVAALAVAALVVTLIVVVAGVDSPPSAPEALARAKRFVDNAEAVEYRGRVRDRYEDEVSGRQTVEASRFEETAVFPDRSRNLVVYDDFVAETVTIDDDSYSREADDPRALDEEQFAEAEDFEGEEFEGAIEPGVYAQVIGAAGRPQVIRQHAGRTSLRFDLPPDDLAGVLLVEEDYFLELEVKDRDGRPLAMHLFANGEYTSQSVAVTFERWNGDLEVEPPPPSDIDPTPFLEEEDVAAFDDAPLYQPRALPVGWVLDSASVLTDVTFEEEGAGCDTVNLYFFDQEDPDGLGYLSLSMAPTSCVPERPSSADDFVAGANQGWINEEEGYSDGVLIVGDTAVQFDSDLTVDELATILGDLVPLDLANPPGATLPLD